MIIRTTKNFPGVGYVLKVYTNMSKNSNNGVNCYLEFERRVIDDVVKYCIRHIHYITAYLKGFSRWYLEVFSIVLIDYLLSLTKWNRPMTMNVFHFLTVNKASSNAVIEPIRSAILKICNLRYIKYVSFNSLMVYLIMCLRYCHHGLYLPFLDIALYKDHPEQRRAPGI